MISETPFWGTIEGFFGRSWDWAARADHIRFLGSVGGGLYIYAPKSDRALRQDWNVPWEAEVLDNLKTLRDVAKAHGVSFGIGICPYNLFGLVGENDTVHLSAKINQINKLHVDLLAVLYDDTRGGAADLAHGQVQVFDTIAALSNASSFAFCPAYYSDDPILDEVFGQRPDAYLSQLGRMLDSSVQVFWTGPQVISESYPVDHLEQTALTLQRKPLIWDNWPVNDSRKLSPFLRLGPAKNRGKNLQDFIAGLICNPMNQAALSKWPLASLAASWQGHDAQAAWDAATVYPPALHILMKRDLALFQDLGFDGLRTDQKDALTADYGRFAQEPAAQEILDWLAGGYVFDPACLT